MKYTFLLIFFSSSIVSCDFISEGDRDDYMGVYKFNFEKSDASNYRNDTGYLKLLTLKISENDSFYFSHEVPFFASKTGSVEYHSIDGFAYCYLVYKKDEVNLDDQVGRDEYGNIYINNPRSKKDAEHINKAYFTRIK